MRRLLVLFAVTLAVASGAGVMAVAQDATPAAGACPAGMATPGASPVAGMLGTPMAGMMATPEASPMASPGALGCVVEIRDFAFHPAQIEISVGTTVTWTNQDSVAHTSTAEDGTWDSGNLDQGQSYSYTFDRPGTHPYVCLYHPNMRGTVVVR